MSGRKQNTKLVTSPTHLHSPDQLKKRMNELPKNKTIIAYCRGPLCVLAIDAINY